MSQTVDRPSVAQPGGQPSADPARRYEPSLDPPAPATEAAPQQHDEHGLPVDPAYTPRFPDKPTVTDGGGLTAVEQGYLDRSVALDSGRAYVRAHETRILAQVRNVKMEDGWYLIGAHGSNGTIAMPNGHGTLDSLGAEAYKRILDNDPTWDGESNLLFLSCESGPDFVRQMYELYGRRVTMAGPDESACVDDNGTVTQAKLERDPATGRPRLDATGNMIFTPIANPLWHVYEKVTDTQEGPTDAHSASV